MSVMTLTSTKAWRNYLTLCAMLDKNDIPYESSDSELCVRCFVNTSAGEQCFIFRIDPSKMLISLCCPVSSNIESGIAADLALAITVINSSLETGGFCLDTRHRLLYFRMTTSFYESNLSGAVFEYLLSSAADAAERYIPRLKSLAACGSEFMNNEL